MGDKRMGLLNKTETQKSAEPAGNQASGDSPVRNFSSSMKNRMGIGSPEQNATDTYERGRKIVPACIRPVKNEITIKQYNIAVLRNLLKFERAEGRMQVTNKRVIFRAAGRSVGGRTILQHEFAIGEIAGIEAKKNYKFSFLYLIFAVLIIVLANLIINGSMLGIMDFRSPLYLYDARIPGIMSPSYILKAQVQENAAIAQRKQAEGDLPKAEAKLKAAKDAEEKATADAQTGILKIRRVLSRDTWGYSTYKNVPYRDTTPAGLKEAQDKLDTAIAAREKAEQEEQAATAALETAKVNEANAIKARVFAENSWKVIMTLTGLILGFGGLIPFFMVNKKFGLKLLILNLSPFGFTLSLAASGFSVWKLFIAISEIIILVCIFLFCFRQNLIIRIKTKGAKEAIDICRDTLFTRRKENGTGFSEVIPTVETESAIREIGAIIGEIQNLGDAGLARLKNPS